MPWPLEILERLRDEAGASARTATARQARDLVLRHAVELVAGDATTLIVNIRGSARPIPVVLTRDPRRQRHRRQRLRPQRRGGL
jgi:hypothetical protein